MTSGKAVNNSDLTPLFILAFRLTISRNPSWVKCILDLIKLTTLHHKIKSNCFLDNKGYELK